ncbi:MAG: DUF2723 domain-containing protein, partial [Candidatus Helarchaeota archaeon]|nr:DUF2723 domain-containing protein [Candidatus Helarchaeota archaeon]
MPFLIYVFTLAPTIYNLDSAELTTAAATLGITRATGYPLYTLMGHLWSKIPIGDVGYRLNLFSAVFGALTIFIADRVFVKWKISWMASFGALGLLASAPYFWGLSLIAEVYTLHTALVAGILYCLVKWDEEPVLLNLVGVAALTGLSLTNHVSSVLLIPGIFWFLISSHPKKVFNPRMMLPALLAGVVALSLYIYLPIRSSMQPVFNYAGVYDEFGVFQPIPLNVWKGFWWLVTGQGFRNLMFAYPMQEVYSQVLLFCNELIRSFSLVGLGPGLFGFGLLIFRKRSTGILLLLWFLFVSGFYINYRVLDKATMFLPCYLFWTIAIAY